jgi:hypothetical protein
MNCKGCSFANPLTFGADIAPMQFHKLLDDGQSQAKSAMATSCRRVRLKKTVEHIREEVWGDALAGINDANLKVRVEAFGQHPHLSANGCKLDGIVKEIPKQRQRRNYLFQKYPSPTFRYW